MQRSITVKHFTTIRNQLLNYGLKNIKMGFFCIFSYLSFKLKLDVHDSNKSSLIEQYLVHCSCTATLSLLLNFQLNTL